MRVDKKLNEWLEQGLISNEQRLSIENYEKNQPPTFTFPGFIWLGVGIIALGIIAIIAANWVLIPTSVKLIACFLFLIASAVSCYCLQNRGLIYDSALLFFMLLCLATIGLVMQVFQLAVPFENALIFWSIITIPVTFLINRPFPVRVWAWLTVIAIGGWLLNIDNYAGNFTFILIFLTLVCLLLGLPKVKFSLFAFHQKVLLEIGCIGALIATFFFGLYAQAYMASLLSLICYLLLSILATMIYFMPLAKWQKILLLPVLILTLLEMIWWWLTPNLPILISWIVILVNLFLLTVFFALNHQKGLYRFGILLFAIRIFWLYFVLIGDLLETSIIMIITGSLIIILARQMAKLKKPFLKLIDYTEVKDE